MKETRTRKTLTKEFKIRTVKLILDGQRPLKAVARDHKLIQLLFAIGKDNTCKMRKMLFPEKVI